MRKNRATILIFMLCVFITNAQDDDSQESQNFDVQKELERQIQIPNTPEAQAFEKYGNTSVSLYTGTPNISVPIYAIPGRELTLPISLTYDASGVKVSQMASQAGLSWNLNAGGRISRTVNGLVDDYINSSPGYFALGNPNSNSNTVSLYNGGGTTGKTLRELVVDYKNPPSSFTSLNEGKQYFNFLKDLSENRFDTQPDYFSFNALGHSDTFVLDVESNTFIALKNPRTKVNVTYSPDGFSLDTWTVILDDGTKFYFEEAEITEKQSSDASAVSIPLQTYHSSWVLTKVISPLSKDTYIFNYDTNSKTDRESHLISSITTTFAHPEQSGYPPPPEHHTSIIDTEYSHKSKLLKKIIHNGKEIVTISFKERLDQKLDNGLDNYSAIDVINIHNPINHALLKKVKFHHSYFGIPINANPENHMNSPYNIRLKLDSVSFLSSYDVEKKSYKFNYISPESVPSRLSVNQDYLGLRNTGNGSSVLYPSVVFNGTVLSGNNRNPNFEYAKTGLLEKITYPTGGYSVFEYEGNEVKEYVSTSATEDITYALVSISGGEVNDNEYCGNCCIDQYGNTPNIQSQTFKIEEMGTYKIDYSENGIAGEAFLIKISDEPKENAEIIPYASIIDQSNCNELQNLTWASYYSDRTSIYLERGTYQLTALKETGNISVKIHREEATSESGYSNVQKAGIRIKAIKNYSNENNLASEKEYKYVTAIVEGTTDTDEYGFTIVNQLNESSGQVLFNPSMYEIGYYNSYGYGQENSDGNSSIGPSIVERQNVTRKTSWSGGDRPHVAYRRVFEIQRKEKEPGSSLFINNGYQVHDFNVGEYNGVSTDQGVSYYRSDFSTGKERKRATFNRSNTIQNEEKSTYTNVQYFGNTTIYPYQNYQNGLYYILFEQISTDTWRYSFIEPKFAGFHAGDWFSGDALIGHLTPQQPDICTESASYFCFNEDYSTLGSRITYAQGKTGGVLSKESSHFFANNTMTTSTSYSYNDSEPNPSYLLKETQTTKSNGDILKQELNYPASGSALYNANIIASPIETKTYKNDVLLSSQKTFFDGLFPSKIQTSKGSSGLEDRLIFERYEFGNLVQARQADGTTIAYIWGYDRQYIIAKVENATYSQIEALSSFGDHFSIEEGLSSDQESQLRAIAGAMVTTYIHKPSVGVTSITDPRGNTIYYEYDEFNRLQFIKDKDGNIVSENQYNYKN